MLGRSEALLNAVAAERTGAFAKGSAGHEGERPSGFLEWRAAADRLTTTPGYMHGEGKNPDTEPVSTTELYGFVGKVLEIAGALTE